MDRANAPLGLNAGDSSRQSEMEETIARLIGERGYYCVINTLLTTVYTLAERSLADPWNFSKQVEFTLWVNAVRTALQRHSEETTFEHRISSADCALAREMGIMLD